MDDLTTEDAPGESGFLPEDFRDGIAPRDSDIFVLLMGPSGSGKTTFISHCTDSKEFVNDDYFLKYFPKPVRAEVKGQGTQEPKVYRCEFDASTNIYLIDTPGFGHKFRGDAETLHEIADFLTKAYYSIPIHSILYFQSILENETEPHSIEYMDDFRRICGWDALKNATLVTTKWDHLLAAGRMTGQEEDSGMVGYWKETVKRYADEEYFRHSMNSRESAMVLLGWLKASPPNPVTLQLQVELAVNFRTLLGTTAGTNLNSYLETRIMRDSAEIMTLRETVGGTNPQLHVTDEASALILTQLAIDELNVNIQRYKTDKKNLASDLQTKFSRRLRGEKRGRELDDVHKQMIIIGLYERMGYLVKDDMKKGDLPVSSAGNILKYLNRKADEMIFSSNPGEEPVSFQGYQARMTKWKSLVLPNASSLTRHRMSQALGLDMSSGRQESSVAEGPAGTTPINQFQLSRPAIDEPVEDQIDEKSVEPRYETALHAAARSGLPSIVKKILIIDPITPRCLVRRSVRGFLPIHDAVVSGSVETVEEFLSVMLPTNVYTQDTYGYTPLALALVDKKWDIVTEITLSHYPQPGLAIADKFAFKEILYSSYDVLSRFLRLSPRDDTFWRLRTEDGSSILHVAMELDGPRAAPCFGAMLYSASTQVLDELLTCTNVYGLTAIAQAASNGRRHNILEFARRFKSRVRIREAVNKESRFGSPFFLAATRGHLECAQALLSLGATRSRLELCGLSTQDWIKFCTGTVTEKEKVALSRLKSQGNLAVTLTFDPMNDYSQGVTERARRYLLEKHHHELLSDPILLCHLSQHYFNRAERMPIVTAGRSGDANMLLAMDTVNVGVTLYALYIYTLRTKFGFSVLRCCSCSSPLEHQFYHCLMCPLADFCAECYMGRSDCFTEEWGSRRQNCYCLPYHPWAEINMAAYSFSEPGDMTVNWLFFRLRQQEQPPITEPLDPKKLKQS
ncbi:hypothetical protein TWF281_000387 [Arthrobotrys megalospora]